MENTRYLSSISKYSSSCFEYGGNSNIFLCSDNYTDRLICYKEFCEEEYINIIKDNINRLISMYGNIDYVIPYSLICDNKKKYTGYIMDFYDNYRRLDTLDLSYEKKLQLLIKCRDLVEKLHKEHKCLHADLAPWNFLYNEINNHLALCDFDTALFLDKDNKLSELIQSIITLEYLKTQKLDEGLDIYLFNLLTFSILNDTNFNEVLFMIRNNKYGIFNDNDNIKNVLEKYKDLSSEKTLKKEYIMDLIN